MKKGQFQLVVFEPETGEVTGIETLNDQWGPFDGLAPDDRGLVARCNDNPGMNGGFEVYSVDAQKVRRRIEDALRKTVSAEQLVRIAQELGVRW